MKLTIHVTNEVLQKTQYCPSGCDSTPTNCAIAFAVREIFPQARVQKFFIHPFGKDMLHDDPDQINMPEDARDFIYLFDKYHSDARLKMNPLSFEIEVPDSVIEKIGIDQVHAILKESKTLSLA